MFKDNKANEYKKEAELKWPDWPSDLIHAAGVVGEESGELMKACLEHHYEGKNCHHIIKEAYHTLVTAARFIEHFEEKTSIPEEWPDNDFLKAEGFDDCIVGVVERFGQEPVLCYNRDRMIRKLEDQGMTRDEAQEYFEYKIVGAWMGDKTPCFIEFGEFKEKERMPVERTWEDMVE